MRMMRLLSITVSCTATIVALLSTAGAAQQKVPFRGDTPIAPSGPLPQRKDRVPALWAEPLSFRQGSPFRTSSIYLSKEGRSGSRG